jgi:hypothetical protein
MSNATLKRGVSDGTPFSLPMSGHISNTQVTFPFSDRTICVSCPRTHNKRHRKHQKRAPTQSTSERRVSGCYLSPVLAFSMASLHCFRGEKWGKHSPIWCLYLMYNQGLPPCSLSGSGSTRKGRLSLGHGSSGNWHTEMPQLGKTP